MKREISIFLALFSILTAKPQGYNTAFHLYNEQVFSSCLINTNVYYSNEVYSKGFIDTAYVYSLNKSGQLRFRKKFTKHEYTHIGKLVPCLDGSSIVMVGNARGCDFIDNSAKTFILKIDTVGNIVFDNTFTNYYSSGGPDNLTCVVQHQDSSFYCTTDSVLFHFNKNGNLIKRKNTGLTLLSALLYCAPNRLLVCGKTAGVYKHLVIDTNGVVIYQANSSGPVNKYEMLSSGSFIALYSNNIIKKLNSALVLTDSSTVTQGANVLLTDFNVYQDSVFSCGYHSVNRTPVYIKFDSLFSNQYQFNSTSKNIIPVCISTEASNVILVSNCTSDFTISTPSFNGVTKMGKQSSYTYSDDIGVTACVIDSSYVTASYGSIMNVTKYTADYRLKVTVKNFGSTTINSFYLNHFVKYMNCGYDLYHQYFNTVSLAPGASTVLTTATIKGNEIGVFSGPPASGNYPIPNLCVFTTLPDEKNDGVVSNDDLCNSPTIPFVLSVENLQETDSYFMIYPNPFLNHLFFESGSKFDEIQLFDLTGKEIMHINFDPVNDHELNGEGLSPGFYLVKISINGKLLRTTKLVK